MASSRARALAGGELDRRFTDVRTLRPGSRFTILQAFEVDANRTVAVKVSDPAGPSWLRGALLHEASVLAEIGSHPHIVTLYQLIHLPDGRPALVLERCTGSFDDTLHSSMKTSTQEAVAIGIKLAGALDTVHSAGLVHCDVRPGNVLLSEWGEPVLAGFDESVTIPLPLGRPPRHVTSSHTAPELLEGSEPTARSDVYGLASTLYELIAGRAAFRAYAGESPAATIARVLAGQVKPIVEPDVPLEMSDLLTWALHADPAERPPSPAWFAEELARLESRQGWPRTHLVIS